MMMVSAVIIVMIMAVVIVTAMIMFPVVIVMFNVVGHNYDDNVVSVMEGQF